MAKNPKKPVSQFQVDLKAAADGLTTNQSFTFNSLVVQGMALSKAEIIAKLRGYEQRFVNVTQTLNAYRAAVLSRDGLMLEMHAFYMALSSVLKQSIAPLNHGQLPSFGIAIPQARTPPSPETLVISKKKAEATRKARGTKGKQQRLAIKPGHNFSIRVLAADGTPYDPTTGPSLIQIPAGRGTPMSGNATPPSGTVTPPSPSKSGETT